MFNKEKEQEIENRISFLCNELYNLKTQANNPYIGEVYETAHTLKLRDIYHCFVPKWFKFKKEHIIDKIDGYTKIKLHNEAIWIENKSIFYYKDTYNTIKKKIEQRCNKKEVKK